MDVVKNKPIRFLDYPYVREWREGKFLIEEGVYKLGTKFIQNKRLVNLISYGANCSLLVIADKLRDTKTIVELKAIEINKAVVFSHLTRKGYLAVSLENLEKLIGEVWSRVMLLKIEEDKLKFIDKTEKSYAKICEEIEGKTYYYYLSKHFPIFYLEERGDEIIPVFLALRSENRDNIWGVLGGRGFYYAKNSLNALASILKNLKKTIRIVEENLENPYFPSLKGIEERLDKAGVRVKLNDLEEEKYLELAHYLIEKLYTFYKIRRREHSLIGLFNSLGERLLEDYYSLNHKLNCHKK